MDDVCGPNEPTDPPTMPSCAICGKPVNDARLKPFCSKRCQHVDLHRWLGGVYRVETSQGFDADSDTNRDDDGC